MSSGELIAELTNTFLKILGEIRRHGHKPKARLSNTIQLETTYRYGTDLVNSRTNQIADWSTRIHHAYSLSVRELTSKHRNNPLRKVCNQDKMLGLPSPLSFRGWLIGTGLYGVYRFKFIRLDQLLIMDWRHLRWLKINSSWSSAICLTIDIITTSFYRLI